jgi:hypothetical protein
MERSMEQEDECHKIRSTIKYSLHGRGWTNLHQAPSRQRPSWENSQDNEGSTRTVKNVKTRMILSPMPWTSTLSYSPCLRTHFEQNMRRLSTPKFYKVKVLNLQEHAHWARCCQLPQLMLHFKLLDKWRTWVTPYQEVHISWSPPWGQMSHLRNKHGGKSYLEDSKHWNLAGR